jgi:hypothetical protein
MIQHQGWQANRNGNTLQDDIAAKLRQGGFREVLESTLAAQNAPVFVRRYRGNLQTLYHTPFAVDFYIRRPDSPPTGLLIHAGYQNVRGSVDHKFPYLVGTLKQSGMPALLLLIGGGASPHALAWVRAQQDTGFTVFTTWEAFVDFAHRALDCARQEGFVWT